MEGFTYINYGKMVNGRNGEFHIAEHDAHGWTVAVYSGYYNVDSNTFTLYPKKTVNADYRKFIKKKYIHAREVKDAEPI